ncbi:hypothetical protein OG909_26260 [Streptomyces sp. NBC_01754]|nr:hypothetical protein [Streptomyces sp. NBC_01754]WSC95511.1 hypothetical protein OG909_26260 [Streptomyces sp. NBC_01754]
MSKQAQMAHPHRPLPKTTGRPASILTRLAGQPRAEATGTVS